MDDIASPRLTSLAHGGGCGCKMSPAILAEILAESPVSRVFPDLLVGTETSDDAAVWRLNDRQALVATTDFFTPIVDDPHLFGRIAATNALSDVYAMGGRPIFCLAVVGMPVGTLPPAIIRAILAGGEAACASAGAPIAGGHSIDSAEPIYGLVALGLVDPARVLRNTGAQPGDHLILTKGLGIGVFSAALKAGALSEVDLSTMTLSTTTLNAVGADLPAIEGVHAVTDVTGFGLPGHALEMARGSGVGMTLTLDSIPILPGAARLAERGVGTGAAARNWSSYGQAIDLPPNLPDWRRALLCDPQTSGGLLIATDSRSTPAVLRLAREAGFTEAVVIGEVTAGTPRILLAA